MCDLDRCSGQSRLFTVFYWRIWRGIKRKEISRTLVLKPRAFEHWGKQNGPKLLFSLFERVSRHSASIQKRSDKHCFHHWLLICQLSHYRRESGRFLRSSNTHIINISFYVFKDICSLNDFKWIVCVNVSGSTGFIFLRADDSQKPEACLRTYACGHDISRTPSREFLQIWYKCAIWTFNATLTL